MRTKAELEALNATSSEYSHSFLTESQRAALDAALAAKQTAPGESCLLFLILPFGPSISGPCDMLVIIICITPPCADNKPHGNIIMAITLAMTKVILPQKTFYGIGCRIMGTA